MTDFDEMYNTLLKKIMSNPRDIPTVPLNGNGIWFYVFAEDDKIYVSSAKEHKPSSKVKEHTLISKKSLEGMYPLYLRRKHGESVSKEAANVCFVQVYCYGIFYYFLEEK